MSLLIVPAILPDAEPDDGTPLETLAALEHRQWAFWTVYLLDHQNPGNIERWTRQIITPYADLTEQEKESDRKWAREVLTILSRSPLPALTILPGTTDDTKTLRSAWKMWGSDMQLDICIEEMAELMQAITKARRNGVTWSYATFEEVADVLVCLQQIEIELRRLPTTDGTTCWDQVLSIRAAKMDRLRERLEEAREADRVAAEDREVA
ncbi:MAG: hypothetical protein WC343_02980 [Bacilli bacterium]|jgi:hypothetical protein